MQPVDSFHVEPADEAQVVESCANTVADDFLAVVWLQAELAAEPGSVLDDA